MPLAGLHAKIQRVDQAGVTALFDNGHGFIGINDSVSQIKAKINIGAIENDNVLTGRFLPMIQGFLTNAGPTASLGE